MTVAVGEREIAFAAVRNADLDTVHVKVHTPPCLSKHPIVPEHAHDSF